MYNNATSSGRTHAQKRSRTRSACPAPFHTFSCSLPPHSSKPAKPPSPANTVRTSFHTQAPQSPAASRKPWASHPDPRKPASWSAPWSVEPPGLARPGQRWPQRGGQRRHLPADTLFKVPASRARRPVPGTQHTAISAPAICAKQGKPVPCTRTTVRSARQDGCKRVRSARRAAPCTRQGGPKRNTCTAVPDTGIQACDMPEASPCARHGSPQHKAERPPTQDRGSMPKTRRPPAQHTADPRARRHSFKRKRGGPMRKASGPMHKMTRSPAQDMQSHTQDEVVSCARRVVPRAGQGGPMP